MVSTTNESALSYTELCEYIVQLDEEGDGMLASILSFQQQLKESRDSQAKAVTTTPVSKERTSSSSSGGGAGGGNPSSSKTNNSISSTPQMSGSSSSASSKVVSSRSQE